MKPKKKEFREPETMPFEVYENPLGKMTHVGVFQRKTVGCRIIREKDYQRLLKAARRKVR